MPLMIASRNGNSETTKVPILAKADINAQDYYRWYTPLMYAVEKGKVLLATKAGINIKNDYDYTAL